MTRRGLRATHAPRLSHPRCPFGHRCTAAAGGIALINAIGNLSGFAGPYVMGYLKDATGNFSAGLLVLAGCTLAGGLVALTLKVSRHLEAAEPADLAPAE